MAVLSVFSSTYSCESFFSVMNFVKSNYGSSLDEEASAAFIALKTTKYKPDIKYLSSLVQQQKSTDSKICLFAFPSFFVYDNMNQGLSLLGRSSTEATQLRFDQEKKITLQSPTGRTFSS
jgi:hypothetical protein